MIRHLGVEQIGSMRTGVHMVRARPSGSTVELIETSEGSPLRVDVVATSPVSLWVVVDGEVDASSAHLLSEALVGHRRGSVTFDCRAVTFMGVAGIDELLSLATLFDVRVMASRSVARVAGLCGVADVLSVRECPHARPDQYRRSS